jgi:thiamine biosynthesis lipoprotein
MTRHPFTHRFRSLGSPCQVDVYAADLAGAALAFAAVEAELERIEGKFSRYQQDSAVSDINRSAAAGRPIALDDETAALIDYAFACHAKSGGLFDVTSGVLRRAWSFDAAAPPEPAAVQALLPLVGMDKLIWRRPELLFRIAGVEIDLGGIGKEYAADRTAAILAALGVTSGLVNLGGDIVVLGPRPDGSPWMVQLQNPAARGQARAEVAVRRGAVATSGDYERYIEADGRRFGHILDPRSGWPVQGLASASVLAPSCMVAGSVATIAMLKGEDGPSWMAAMGLPHFWIAADDRAGGDLPGVYG